MSETRAEKLLGINPSLLEDLADLATRTQNRIELESVIQGILGVGMEFIGGRAAYCYENRGMADGSLHLRVQLDIMRRVPLSIAGVNSLSGGKGEVVESFFTLVRHPEPDGAVSNRSQPFGEESNACVLKVSNNCGVLACLIWMIPVGVSLPAEWFRLVHLLEVIARAVFTIGDGEMRREIREGLLDPITGLVSETQLLERLRQEMHLAALRNTALCAVCLDLDRFSELGFVYGYQFGHLLLARIAEVILENLPESGFAARYSGDRFAVALPGGSARDAVRLISDVIEGLGNPILVAGTAVQAELRAGIATLFGTCNNPEDLLQTAEAGLALAKGRVRRKRFLLRSTRIDQIANNPLRLEHELREAVKTDQFELHFQPILNARGELHACECLLRWRRPHRGIVGPSIFIPVAEATGLMPDLGAWVIRNACTTARQWYAEGHRICVTINISPAQLDDPNLSNLVLSNVAVNGLPRSAIAVEITESALLDLGGKNSRVLGNLNRLHSAGIRIALDDFGVGYSCLAYLRDCPLNVVKLDHSFVRTVDSPGGQTLTRAIVRLLHDMHYQVVAEGIETAEQLQIMKQFGADYFQGYFLGRPMRVATESGIRNSHPIDH